MKYLKKVSASQLISNEGTIIDSMNPGDDQTVNAPSIHAVKDYVENYSTTEQRIGTWIDSKPLYRIVFTGTTGSGTYNIFGNIPNINKVISIRGTIIGSGGAVNDTIPNYWDNNTKNIIQCNPSSGDVFITYGSTYQNRDFIVIVEYTKTTD